MLGQHGKRKKKKSGAGWGILLLANLKFLLKSRGLGLS